jgi:pyruvate formate lyase activating enzyme
MFTPDKCIGCKACYNNCPTGALTFENRQRNYDKSKCVLCGKCVSVCPGGALYWVSKKMSAREVFDTLISDLPYYQNSGGGVTISGGEPLAQPEFSAAILAMAKERGLGTAIETSLAVSYDYIRKLIPVTDLFYCDLKLIDSSLHKEHVGAANDLILENLKRLYAEGKPIVIHTPLVPGITDTKENIGGIVKWMKQNIPGASLELLNYNPLAKAKWQNLNLDYKPGDLKPLKENVIKDLAALGEKAGIKTLYRMG